MLWRGKSGQITIFSLIVLLAVMGLAGLLVDISRIHAGRSIVKSAVETSARSILADYGSRLKDDYGIFAVPSSDAAELGDLFEETLSWNLSIPEEKEKREDITDLFGFRVERIQITPIFNLSENEITKQQILEYMKYRAPTELVEGFVEKLAAMKDVGKMSEAYQKKVSIDKILGRMDKSQQKLKKDVDGSGSPGEKFINGFNLGGIWEEAFRSYNTLSSELSTLKSNLESADSSIDALEERLKQEEAAGKQNQKQDDSKEESAEQTDGSDPESAADSTKKEIEALREERSSLQRDYSGKSNQLQSVWNELRYALTADFEKANENAANEIEKIMERGKQAQKSIAELETFLNSNFNQGETGEFSRDFRGQVQSELDGLKAMILDGKKAEEMSKDVIGNASLLKTISEKLDTAVGQSGSGSIPVLPPQLLESIKGYAGITYDYFKPDKGDKRDDPRKGKAEAVKNFIAEKILQDVSYEAKGIRKEDLPSGTKAVTRDFGQQDMEFIGTDKPEASLAGSTVAGAEYPGDFGNIGREADLFDEESMYQENALGFLSDIGKLAAGKAADLRDNIYLNEYIMGTFKNSVPEIRTGNETSKDENLHGVEKSTLETFYDSEVEYVLHGNASQKINNIMTKAELLTVRFGLNSLHVYTDAKKKTMAAGIATAVAGWWTGGAGIPVISNLILCGWGMGESLIDLTDLMDGKSVPLYKMKGDWRLDIGLPAASGPKTNKALYFNYQDYLRLFLLTMSEEKKLNRVEDLIQLNIGKEDGRFRISECSTCVRVEAEVSMKYLFLPMSFFQKVAKTGDGRYLIKILLYEGYQ